MTRSTPCFPSNCIGWANIQPVIPTKAGYTFSPSSRMVTVNGANVTGVTFTATPAGPTYTISGTIGPPASGAGASVQLGGTGSATVAADSSGNYVFAGLPNGTYTVTPGKSGYAFTPASRSVSVSGADATGISFTALGPDKARANSYDNAWETAWVNHARSVLTTRARLMALCSKSATRSPTRSLRLVADTRPGKNG